jgi:dihydropteroate synthase
MRCNLMGILNTTPDSFSDGGLFLSLDSAANYAKLLFRDGADIIDIGGDSTRPNSVCAGEEVEWSRICKIVEYLASLCPVSVDTHWASIARKSINLGVKCINDISGGYDPEMFNVIADSNVQYVLTHTRCKKPHTFGKSIEGDPLSTIVDFFSDKLEKAIKAGVRTDQIILDPGMGAFLSDSSDVSWKVLAGLKIFSSFKLPLLIGVSRKGFIRSKNEQIIYDRDSASAFAAIFAMEMIKKLNTDFYIRAHNIAIHKEMLHIYSKLKSNEYN